MAEVNDVYEARFVCTLGDQTSINVRHYLVTAKAGTGGTDLEFANVLDAALNSLFKALLANSATYRGVGVRRIKPLPISLETSTIGSLGVGTAGAAAMPRQTSGVITLRSAVGGRSRRGRLYAPFPSQTDNDTTGVPTGGYNTRLGSLAGALIVLRTWGAGGNTNTAVAVIFSRKLNLTTDTSTATTTLKWATQRSRGSYGRPNPPPF